MEDGWTLAIILIKAGLYVTSFVAAGTVLFLISVRPNGPAIHGPTRLFSGASSLIALSFLALHVAAQAGFLADEGFAGMVDRDMINIILEGPLGLSSKVLLLGLLTILLTSFIPMPINVIYGWVAGIGALFIVISFTLIGHTTNGNIPVSAGLIALHLFAVSFWLGALWPLYRQAQNNKVDELIATAESFGKQAMLVVPALLVAGLVLSVFLVGSVTALFTTAYGLLLIGKVGLVILLLGLAALNKYRFIPALKENEPEALNHFTRSVRLEVLLFSGILLITAVLTSALELPTG
ncbi:MAG: CopD family protein [Hyphomicrobiales bacterium]